MRTILVTSVLFGFTAAAQPAPDKMTYREFRYTGYGAADPARDRGIVERYKDLFLHLSIPNETIAALANAPAGSEHTVQEIEEMRAFLARPHSGRAEQLKADLYRKRLGQLEKTPAPTPDKRPEPTPRKQIESVTALVDTLPVGVVVKDGTISSDEGTQLLGRFSISTQYSENEEELLKRVKVLAAAAGGNIVVFSYRHVQSDAQGTCHGASGVVVYQRDFDPKRVKMGKLPVDI